MLKFLRLTYLEPLFLSRIYWNFVKGAALPYKKFVFLLLSAIISNVFAEAVKVNLDVDTAIVYGQAKGHLDDVDKLEKAAIDDALNKYNADVLVDLNLFYETKGNVMTVTAAGYPAHYTVYRFTPAKMSVSLTKPYMSVKAQASVLPFSTVGVNVEAGYLRKGFFASLDFGFGHDVLDDAGNDWGGGIAVGTRLQPAEWFQIIQGGYVGMWIFDYNHYKTEYEPFVWGAFAKFLFGKNKCWFEISDRILLGSELKKQQKQPLSQIRIGFTYTPYWYFKQ